MTKKAEAQILREIYKFVQNGLLYKGVKPVMWSVVEKTALAEAEIEYAGSYLDDFVDQIPGYKNRQQRIRRRKHRHLDDNSVDNPRQPRDCIWQD